MGKILRITLKLNFTQDTLDCYGLIADPWFIFDLQYYVKLAQTESKKKKQQKNWDSVILSPYESIPRFDHRTFRWPKRKSAQD